MTAHQFRLQPDPTLCGLSSFHKQTVGSVVSGLLTTPYRDSWRDARIASAIFEWRTQ